jgi:hypothetical protein
MGRSAPICLAVFTMTMLTNWAQGQTTTAGALAGDTTAIERSTYWREAMPLKASLPGHVTFLLRPQDILSYAAPGVLFPVRNIGLQCQGVNATLVDVPKRATTVNTTGTYAEPRFGEANFGGERVFRLAIGARDVLAPGVSPRCELVSYPMPDSALPEGENFWLAFSFWADDWSGTQDDQSIAQMHIQDPRNILLNPFFALVVRGEEMRVELRHNSRDTPDQTSTRVVSTTRLKMPAAQWVTAVIQARFSNNVEKEPFLHMWLNGTLVAEYAGPFGYLFPTGGYAYPKVGVYHWLVGNPWDVKLPTRSLLVGAMITVRDPTARYTQEMLQTTIAVTSVR